MSATSVVHDLWLTLRTQSAAVDGKAQVRLTRVIIAVLSLIAMGLALLQPRVIYTFVLFAWGALGAAFTPVILLTLHWKRLTWQGALASLILGPSMVVVWKLVPGLSEALYELVPAAIVSTLAAVVVSRMTARRMAQA